MKTIVEKNSIFIWIILITMGLLSIPLIAMNFTSEVNWTLTDFIVMAVLILSISFSTVIISRKIPQKHRAKLFAFSVLLFIYVWAELAVGVFFPEN